MRVGVLGAGVVGLCTSLLLLRRGHAVTVYADRLPPDVTSNLAGAIWLPLLTSDPARVPAGYEERLSAWSRDSWHTLGRLVGPDLGVRRLVNHELFPDEQAPPPYLVELMPDLQATCDDRLPAGYRYRWSFTTLVAEMPRYLSALLGQVRSEGATLVGRRFRSLDEVLALPEPVLCNCLGLGAAELFDDRAMSGIKGQVLIHEPVDLGFALGAYDFGVLPRSDALLLGSLFQAEYDTVEPTTANTDLIWSTISRWQRKVDGGIGLPPGLLDRRRVGRVVAGLRPYRSSGVRVEVEAVGGRVIVHDYGHGGSGFTLSWGCALAAADLVRDL
jgi:D-amino-acid oxidase